MTETQKQIDELNKLIDPILPEETLIKFNIPNEVYHGCKGDSSSKIKDSLQSMMFYNARYNTGEIEGPTGAHFDVGNLAHAMILEPETVEHSYLRKPDTPQPTQPQRDKYDKWVKLGKPSKEEDSKAYPTALAVERCEFWDDLHAKSEHLKIVDEENWTLAENMAKAVNSNPMAKKLLEHPSRNSEVSYFKRDGETGRILKCRTDIDVGSIIADVKTISLRNKIDEDYLLKILYSEVVKRKYHLSAAMYCDITGADEFLWIFVNKEPNYHWVAVIGASEKLLEQGRELYQKQVTKLQSSTELNHWPEPSSIQRTYNPYNERLEIPFI